MTQVFVAQDTPQVADELGEAYLKGTKRGELCVMDFFIEQVIEENAFQVRAGTVTTAITGDVAITDQAAEMAIAATLGTTMLPVEVWISIDVDPATDPLEIGIKSVAGTYTLASGVVVVPLNLCLGGKAAATPCEAQTGGGVTVPAETATTTRQHLHFSKEFAKDSGTEWAGKNTNKPSLQGDLGRRNNPMIWTPTLVPVLKGAACFYIQVAGGAAPNYFAHIDYIELPTTSVS